MGGIRPRWRLAPMRSIGRRIYRWPVMPSAPHFSFWRPKKRNGLRPVQREKTLYRAPVQWPSARTGVSRAGADQDCRPSTGSRRAAHFPRHHSACPARRSSGWKIAWPLLLNPLPLHGPRRGRQRLAAAQPLAALPLTDAACPLRVSGRRGKRSWSNAPLHPRPPSAPRRGDRRTSLNRPRRVRGQVVVNTEVPSHVQPPYDKRPLGLCAQSRA